MHIISNSLVTRSYSKQNCQWILELWSKKENKHPCRIAQKHWFSSSSSLWRFNKNELLMRNHQSRPTRSESFPEVNAMSSQTRGCGRGWGRGHGHGRNPWYHGSYNNNSQKRKASLHHHKWNNIEVKQENGKCLQDKPSKNHENKCYRCGMNEH